MSVPYVLTHEAQAHIDEIGAYIAQDSVDAALKVYDAFEEAFGLPAERPGLGHSREDLTGVMLTRISCSTAGLKDALRPISGRHCLSYTERSTSLIRREPSRLLEEPERGRV